MNEKKRARMERVFFNTVFLSVAGMILIFSGMDRCEPLSFNPGDPKELLGSWLNTEQSVLIRIEDWPTGVKGKPDSEIRVCGSKTAKLTHPVRVGFGYDNVDIPLVLKLPNYAYGGLYTVDGETYLYYWYKGRVLIFAAEGPVFNRVKTSFGSLILETANPRDSFCVSSGCSSNKGIQSLTLERVQ